MNIESMSQQMSQLVDKAGQDVQNTMNAESLNDPAKMLQAQFALQQYSTFIGYQSAVMKSVKDMMAGIIAKI